jgi:hypothetical protein
MAMLPHWQRAHLDSFKALLGNSAKVAKHKYLKSCTTTVMQSAVPTEMENSLVNPISLVIFVNQFTGGDLAGKADESETLIHSGRPSFVIRCVRLAHP